jgi:hypothetical protein
MKLEAAALGLTLGLAMLRPTTLKADEKLFTYSYEAEVLPKGALEFEQWVTQYQGHAAGVFSRWKSRQELEYGILDDLSASIYLNFESTYSSLIDPATGTTLTDSETSFDGVSTEWKWRLLNPDLQPLGLLLYLEPRFSGPELELEGKVVLQQNLGEKWVSVLNLTVENEYAYTADAQSLEGELEISGGLAYKLTPVFSLGLEARDLRVWPGWADEGSSAWYLGPAFHAAAEKWWATLTVLPQVHGGPETIPGDGRDLNDDDHAKVETRLILGLNF